MQNSVAKQLNNDQKLDKLIDSLIENWSDWDRYENEYLSVVIPNILAGEAGTEKEREVMARIKGIVSEDKIPELANLIKNRRYKKLILDNLIGRASKFLIEGNLDGALGVIDECEKLGGDVSEIRSRIDLALGEQEKLRQDAEKINSLKDALVSLESALKEKDYIKADAIILNQTEQEAFDECQKIKTKYVKADLEKLEKVIGENFDKEKVSALARTAKNLLVQARAGSGKTTLIALKVRQLVECYGAKPEEILVLAFNQKAANEFSERIKEYIGPQVVASKQNASTFHSLAWRLVKPGEALLFNDKKNGNEYVKGLQTEFIGRVCEELRRSDRGVFLSLLYNFFKALTKERKRGEFANDAQYYLYRRNLEYVSLDGDRVKSKSEKIIADFLFEHELSRSGKLVKYEYEHPLQGIGGSGKYKPDFSLFYEEDESNPIAIFEYFGVTTAHPASRSYMTSEEEKKYLADKQKKFNYCQQRSLPLIEMSADDYDDLAEDQETQREQFEKKIQIRLEAMGFSVTALGQTELINRIDGRRNTGRLYEQLTNFINRAKKSLITPNQIRDKAQNYPSKLDSRSGIFIKLAIRVYQKYTDELLAQHKIDFDDLLKQAADKILETEGDCTIDVFDKPQPIKNIKWILIDEYQDFTELFYYFIRSILAVNPTASVFCVGDDWQAINSFAGSDLTYFDNFETYFQGGCRTQLLMNYRSDKNIVLHANQIMDGLGAGGHPSGSRPDGGVYAGMLDYVKWQDDSQYQTDFEADSKYRDAAMTMTRKNSIAISRYIKTLEKIIIKNPGRSICFLFRTKELYGTKIEKFKKIFEDWHFNDGPNNKIIVSTVHSYKGKESDVVVIVDANKRNYPKFHPDNELMEILGVSVQKVVEEERRLFYVAITRAKKRLYILYEKNDERSDFISTRWQYLPLS
jgi:DNA helicase IV